MSFLVFDTETTGLPESFNVEAGPLTLDNWDHCRMVQIAWRIYNADNELLIEQCHLVKPVGFDIPLSSTAIHKITTELAEQQGLSIDEVFTHLFMNIHLYGVKRIVAHNIKFDDNVVLSELYRSGNDDLVSVWRSLKKHCTMIAGKSLFGGRWPKLHMLYTKMVGPIHNMNALHDAAEDCRLCAEIYIANSA